MIPVSPASPHTALQSPLPSLLLLFCSRGARRTDRSDPGQLDQQLPPARDGSATLLHATADESSLVVGKRHRRMASRSLETSSRCPIRRSANPRSSHNVEPTLHVSLIIEY